MTYIRESRSERPRGNWGLRAFIKAPTVTSLYRLQTRCPNRQIPALHTRRLIHTCAWLYFPPALAARSISPLPISFPNLATVPGNHILFIYYSNVLVLTLQMAWMCHNLKTGICFLPFWHFAPQVVFDFLSSFILETSISRRAIFRGQSSLPFKHSSRILLVFLAISLISFYCKAKRVWKYCCHTEVTDSRGHTASYSG